MVSLLCLFSAVWELVPGATRQLFSLRWRLRCDGVARWRPLERRALQLSPGLHLQERHLWVVVFASGRHASRFHADLNLPQPRADRRPESETPGFLEDFAIVTRPVQLCVMAVLWATSKGWILWSDACRRADGRGHRSCASVVSSGSFPYRSRKSTISMKLILLYDLNLALFCIHYSWC